MSSLQADLDLSTVLYSVPGLAVAWLSVTDSLHACRCSAFTLMAQMRLCAMLVSFPGLTIFQPCSAPYAVHTTCQHTVALSRSGCKLSAPLVVTWVCDCACKGCGVCGRVCYAQGSNACTIQPLVHAQHGTMQVQGWH